MPLRIKDLEDYGAPIRFEAEGCVTVLTGPCSGSALRNAKIPLDGRHYVCAGQVILKNGMALRANFEINTHTFDFLVRDSVRVFIAEAQAWYSMDEPELFDLIGVKKEDALPYRWNPDVPLDYSVQGPYPMHWPTQ